MKTRTLYTRLKLEMVSAWQALLRHLKQPAVRRDRTAEQVVRLRNAAEEALRAEPRPDGETAEGSQEDRAG